MAKFDRLPYDKSIVDRSGSPRVRFASPDGLSWPSVSSWDFVHWHSFLSQHGWSVDEVKQYYYYDRFTYGFGLRHSDNDPFKWFYLPVPRAVDFHATKTPNILYGGAVGGTKSTTARWDAYRQCWSIPEFTALIMRRTHQELKRNHMKFVARESKRINDFVGREIMEWVPTEFELRFKHNNSVILFGHCQNEGDEEKYLSDEYDAFYPDEMATFLKQQILGVASRLRSVARDGVRLIPRLGGTSNPGGAHTLWMRDYFILRQLNEADAIEDPRYDAADYTYIHARLYDNPYLMDPDGTFSTYENRVYARGGTRARQLINGDWSAITGQFFEEFSHKHVGRLFIPPGTKVERWIDWGYSKPGICLWVAILPSGHLYIFHEYVFTKTLPSIVAKHIRAETVNLLNQHKGMRLGKTVGDPAMWGIDSGTGEAIERTFGRNGVVMQEGDNQRVLGWSRLREWYAIAPDGIPWMMIDPSCVYTVRTIPALVVDKNDPEDLETRGEDHAADAKRYGVMSRPSPDVSKLVSPVLYLPDSVGAMLNELQSAGATTRRSGQVA